MKNIYMYRPDICDGDYCPQDCDRCPKKEKVLEINEEEDNGQLFQDAEQHQC